MAQGDSQSSSSTPSRRVDPLDRLRGLRVRPERARDLSSDMQTQMKTLRKVSRTESSLLSAWSAAAPDQLAQSCVPIGIRAGRFEIEVPDASMKFQADRWLRSGGLAELSALAKVPIAGVRLRIGANS